MRIEAAVTYEKGAPFKIEEVELDAPKFGEILVRIVASGICHTDEAVQHQFIPTPLPAVLGHEGAGVVEAVGPKAIPCLSCSFRRCLTITRRGSSRSTN